jgi:hypothetical protein
LVHGDAEGGGLFSAHKFGANGLHQYKTSSSSVVALRTIRSRSSGRKSCFIARSSFGATGTTFESFGRLAGYCLQVDR